MSIYQSRYCRNKQNVIVTLCVSRFFLARIHCNVDCPLKANFSKSEYTRLTHMRADYQRLSEIQVCKEVYSNSHTQSIIHKCRFLAEVNHASMTWVIDLERQCSMLHTSAPVILRERLKPGLPSLFNSVFAPPSQCCFICPSLLLFMHPPVLCVSYLSA